MGTHLDPHLTVAQAGPLLEHLLCERLGDEEFKRLTRTLALQLSEQTTDEEGQLLGIITILGKSQDQITIWLCFLWLARTEGRDPLVSAMLTEARQKTLEQLLQEARKAITAANQEE